MRAAIGTKKRRGEKPSIAQRADPHDLYQRSVQAPEQDIAFFDRVFRRIRGRRPLSLREDFCGTAYLSAHWAASDPRRRALAIDHHRETLEWGRAHNLDPAGLGVAERVSLREADVLEVAGPPVDLACAMNFSYCAFKTRAELGRYFRVVHRGLAPDGLFVSELYGGSEAIVELEEPREVEDFTMVWEQERFNPIDHHTLCHIHFEFSDGSRIERAFTYDWRLWTVPEVRELLAEAGFERTEVWWEEVDEEGDGTGEHRRTEEEENQEAWLVYLVAVK